MHCKSTAWEFGADGRRLAQSRLEKRKGVLDRPRPDLHPAEVAVAALEVLGRTVPDSEAGKAVPCPECGKSARATHQKTVPTGFCSLPPPGPAMPVIDTATWAREWARAPSAMARATGWLTAPWPAITAADTPSISLFASFE